MQQVESNNETDATPPDSRKAYFVGSGIASLAGAAFLIRDGLIPGEDYSHFRGT